MLLRELVRGTRALLFASLIGLHGFAMGQLAPEPLAQLTNAANGASAAGEAMLGRVNNGAMSIASIGFEENKGQVKTTDGQPAPFVRYRFTKGNTSIFLLESGIAYQFERVHHPAGYAELMAEAHRNPEKQQDLDALSAQVHRETYRMDMYLEGADQNARTSTDGRSDDYTNYYNHDALDVHHYSRVTYHEVYPSIDWVIYTTDKGMKYDFVVHPGADPARIKLRFLHHEELRLEADGSLTHGNRMGRFTEQRPVSLQDGHEVPTRFVLEGDPEQPGQAVLRFALDAYDRSGALVIDPARLWGTYYGGSDNEWGRSCAVDGSGNVFLAGTTSSTTAIASGGNQNTFGGGSGDAFLVKFDAAGIRQWATYCGGSDDDGSTSCAVDGSGNVFLAGGTRSTTGIASGGHQNDYGGGGDDAFVAKFDAAGFRQWATYYGGSASDQGTCCAVDGSGNVFLSGETRSTTGIAMGGHQNDYGGLDVAFLVKFNGAGVRQWGTYYGGGQTRNNSCTADDSGNVFLAGMTDSPINIASGGHQNTYGGGSDGFDAYLAKFDAAGIRQWATYYGGSAFDLGWSCAVDGNGNVFLAGETQSTTAIASGGHQNTIGGAWSSDAFLVKFDAAGIRQWSTYYGGSEQDHGYSCAVDGSGNVFLAGYTWSTTAIASGGHQNTHGGGYDDAFLVKFSAAGIRQWGTYYGGSDPDYGRSCAVDGSGNVFLAGSTGSTNAIASGGHQNTYGGGEWNGDAFLAKFQGGTDVGIGEAASNGFEVFPNPGDGLYTVRLAQPPAPSDHFLVLDVTGKLVLQGRLTGLVSTIDMGGHGTGVYVLQLILAGGVRTERLVKR